MDCDPETVERQPTIARRWQAFSVPHEEQEIGVAPSTVSAMPGMHPSPRAAQIAHAKRLAPGKRIGDLARCAFDRADQGRSAVASPLARAHSSIAPAAIRKGNRLV